MPSGIPERSRGRALASRDTSVYVHFPWCLRKCPYCDFGSRPIDPGAILHGSYADALIRELAWRAPRLGGRRLVSVFFGGGTPSLWDPAELGRVLAEVRGAFDAAAPRVEVTIECNPSSVDDARVAELRETGVNRLSVGVQSLDDDQLRFLGRLHDAASARDAVRAARRSFDRVSCDLLYALPGQNSGAFLAQVDPLLDLGVSHVSAYALTIEPNTIFGQRRGGRDLPTVDNDAQAELMIAVADGLAARGLDQYEVSNFSVPCEEAAHNQHYWKSGCYVGLGSAAVGCLHENGRAYRWKNTFDIDDYLTAPVPADRAASDEHLGPEDIIREGLMLGLRTREGVDLGRVAELSGIDPRFGRERAIARRTASGDLQDNGNRLCVPRSRWPLLDTIVADLF